MAEPIIVAKSKRELQLLPQMANRHGLIAGATGTGKTTTLQSLAEKFSRRGVPVFVADVKGDLAGIAEPGGNNAKLTARFQELGITPQFAGAPVTFWDVFGQAGHSVRTTVSAIGPVLLARLLNLNDVQTGVLNVAFKVADDNGLLLLDTKDLRAMLQHLGENATAVAQQYGNVSTASLGAIQRSLLALEQQGGDKFLGEPALELDDLLQNDEHGRGIVNVLAAERLLQSPLVYSTFLLWLLSELFEHLPEIGDPEKPRLVFFFDEAHLLFEDAPKPLLDRIEQLVRMIRSKGVGVYLVTQSPDDVPDRVLAQLGNRVQHALRAFTPRDQKAVKVAAETFRPNPAVDVTQAITELKVGEALVSLLDEHGAPEPVERAFVVPPESQLGPITAEQRREFMASSLVAGHYEQAVDRESAYEILKQRAQSAAAPATSAPRAPSTPPLPESGSMLDKIGTMLGGATTVRGRSREGMGEAMVKSAMRAAGSQIGRQIMRGVMGSLLGGSGTRRRY
jgi:DNA helicase HerA-like ATPase